MATAESVILDFGAANAIELTGSGLYQLEAFDPGLAPRRPQFIGGAEADGQVLFEDPRYDDAVATATVRIMPATDGDMVGALNALNALTAKLQECSASGPDGIPVQWTTSGTGTASYLMYWKLAEYDGAPPLETSGELAGWFQAKPVVKLKATRKPFLYGQEVTTTAVTTTTPIALVTLVGVPGDVAAEARLIVTDGASQSRRYLEWGLQQRYYQGLALEIDSGSLVTSGFAGVSTAGTGSYNTNVIRATLTTTAVAVAGTGNLSNIGTFRVKARVKASSSAEQVRLSWQDGSGIFRSNDYATPPVSGAWAEVDLGTVAITPALSGTQRWTGKIEAYGVAGDTIDVDYLVLVPAGEGYGKARAPQRFETVSVFSARDEFNQSAGALSGKALPVGGTWGGAGSATDLTVETTGHTATRATTGETLGGGRFATAGTTTFTDALAQVDVKSSVTAFGVGGPLVRYVNTTNWCVVYPVGISSGSSTLTMLKNVGGGIFTITGPTVTHNQMASTTIRVVVDSSGRFFVWLFAAGSVPSASPVWVGGDADLATGGALASGKSGIYDEGNTPGTRNYDNFIAAAPAADAVVFSGRKAEIRSDSAIRQDSGGTVFGPVPSYYGSRFYLPSSGTAGRTSRVLVKAHRNDIEANESANVTDSTTVQVAYTPRFLVAR